MSSCSIQCERAIFTISASLIVLCIIVLFSFSLLSQILCCSPSFSSASSSSSSFSSLNNSIDKKQKYFSSVCQEQYCENNNNRNRIMMDRKEDANNLICSVQLLTFTLLKALFFLSNPVTSPQQVNGTIVLSTQATSGTLSRSFDSLQNNSYASNEYFVHERYHSNRKSALLALWPRPLSYSSGNVQYLLSSSVKYLPIEQISDCDIIINALRRYSSILNATIQQLSYENMNAQGSIYDSKNTFLYDEFIKLDNIHLIVDEPVHCSDYPNFFMKNASERYTIEIRSSISTNVRKQPRDVFMNDRKNAEAILLSPTIWGLLRALETFTQLFYPSSIQLKPDTIETLPPEIDETIFGIFINNTKIEDSPRFSYRGLMIDTARHFIPTKLIIKNLEAMSYSKLNTMHWHLSDDQAFSFFYDQFKKDLTLQNKQSNHKSERTYSRSDVESIVAAGRLRGIQIIPEIDTPSHAKALGMFRPELLIHCPNNGAVQLNPILDETHEFVANLFQNLAQILPNLNVHIGFDDVSHSCWLSNSTIQEYMTIHKLTNGAALEEYYMKKLIKKLSTFGRSAIVWQDPIDNNVNLPNGTIVQIWKDTKQWDGYSSWQSYAQRTIIKSHPIIVSSCWFISEMKHAKDWLDFYSCDPGSFTTTILQKRLLLGGEACLWTDFIDATNLMPILWPRVAAVAERLWSLFIDSNSISILDVQRRLAEHRCRLLRRGIAAQPIQPGYCDYFDWNNQDYFDDIHEKINDNNINNNHNIVQYKSLEVDNDKNSKQKNTNKINDQKIARIVENPILSQKQIIGLNKKTTVDKEISENQHRIKYNRGINRNSKQTRETSSIFVTNLDKSWSWRLVSEVQSLELQALSSQTNNSNSASILFLWSIYSEYSLLILLTYFLALFSQ